MLIGTVANKPATPAATPEALAACWQQFFAGPWAADTACQPLLDSLARLTAADGALLLLLDEPRRALVCAAAIGLASLPGSTTTPRDIAGWLAQHSSPLLWCASGAPPACVRDLAPPGALSAAICVPLLVAGRQVGVLKLVRYRQHLPFDSHDYASATLVAGWLAAALGQARLRGQVEHHERLIHQIVESIPGSLLVLDRGLNIVSANRNFLEKSRRNAEQTIGRPVAAVFPPVLLEYTRLDQKIRDVFHTGQRVDGGKLAYRAPGSPRRVYYYCLVPLAIGGAVQHVMLLMDDITEREQLGAEVRRVERHLASVVECANDLVVSLDAQGRIVTWNPAAERACGLTADEARGQPLLELCSAEGRPLMARLLRTCLAPRLADRVERRIERGQAAGLPTLAGELAAPHSEVPLLTAAGGEVSIAWNASAMRDDAGRVSGVVLLGRDLTEHQRLEAQLAQSSKMASLGVMAGGIAHELRNPLGIVASTVQLLDEHPADDELRSVCVAKIVSATRRAALIIDNLLRFARPQPDRLRPVQLDQVLEAMLPMLSHHLVAQHVTLVPGWGADVPAIRGNAELLQQVFTNLALNACNAMPAGGTLTINLHASADSHVEISFADTGCGILPEHLPKIFDPFFTTMPVGKGTGLGLSISYSIVQHHGGTISVVSQPGQGARFTVRLPVAS